MQTKILIFFTGVIGAIIHVCRQRYDDHDPEYTLSSNDSFSEGVTFYYMHCVFHAGKRVD